MNDKFNPLADYIIEMAGRPMLNDRRLRMEMKTELEKLAYQSGVDFETEKETTGNTSTFPTHGLTPLQRHFQSQSSPISLGTASKKLPSC